jgi:hypothetical protein
MVFIKGENKFTPLKLINPRTFHFFPISKTGYRLALKKLWMIKLQSASKTPPTNAVFT